MVNYLWRQPSSTKCFFTKLNSLIPYPSYDRFYDTMCLGHGSHKPVGHGSIDLLLAHVKLPIYFKTPKDLKNNDHEAHWLFSFNAFHAVKTFPQHPQGRQYSLYFVY